MALYKCVYYYYYYRCSNPLLLKLDAALAVDLKRISLHVTIITGRFSASNYSRAVSGDKQTPKEAAGLTIIDRAPSR